MELFQQRVKNELIELSDRRDRLEEFVGTNAAFDALPEDERDRLRRQLRIMIEYECVLRERIEHFRGQ